MGQRAAIDLKKLGKDLGKITDTIEKMENIAMVRTLNIAAKESKKMIAEDVYEDTGISKATAKRRITIYKASKGNHQAALFMKDSRVTYPSPRVVGTTKKKSGGRTKTGTGISFIAAGKVRKKVTTKQRGGSRPFIIKGRHSGKKLPVYVLPEHADGKTADQRKVTAMYFSSLPHVARNDWQNKVQKFSVGVIRKEYPKQLKKARKGF